jgi:hypothetical protein
MDRQRETSLFYTMLWSVLLKKLYKTAGNEFVLYYVMISTSQKIVQDSGKRVCFILCYDQYFSKNCTRQRETSLFYTMLWPVLLKKLYKTAGNEFVLYYVIMSTSQKIADTKVFLYYIKHVKYIKTILFNHSIY